MDPTKTKALRSRFRYQAQVRLRRLRKLTREVLVEQDVMNARTDPILKLFPNMPVDISQRLVGFRDWFKRATYAVVVENGEWMRVYIEQAWLSGDKAAKQILGTPDAPDVKLPDHYYEMARHELEGICDVLIQQTVRVVANGAITQAKPLVIYRNAGGRFDAIGVNRLNGLCNYFIVRLHNAARIAQFKAAGIAEVGIIPEGKAKATHTHKIRAA